MREVSGDGGFEHQTYCMIKNDPFILGCVYWDGNDRSEGHTARGRYTQQSGQI